jgi:hypothetical protein
MNDIEPRLDLTSIDPGDRDPHYWERFQHTVMRQAMPSLARRGKRVRVTVGGVVTSWSRLIVPSAVAAAAVAGVFFLPQVADDGAVPGPVPQSAAVVPQPAYMDADPMPAFLVSEGEPDLRAILFTLDEF